MSLDDSNYLKKLFINEVVNALPETVDDEVIVDAVNDYLADNPVNAGATVEEAAQIKANKEAIEKLQNGGVGKPGEDGKDGVSPTVTVTAIDGGHRVTITDVNGTKYFDVANGKDGVGGEGGTGVDGEDGGYYTPSVDASGNLTWSGSKTGMPTVAVANIKGPTGEDGKTPEKGVDYWTEADRQQIVSDVLVALPNASGVNF